MMAFCDPKHAVGWHHCNVGYIRSTDKIVGFIFFLFSNSAMSHLKEQLLRLSNEGRAGPTELKGKKIND